MEVPQQQQQRKEKEKEGHEDYNNDDVDVEVLLCAICRDSFRDPKTGFAGDACGHVLCCSCLRDYVTTGGKTCPTCRADLTVDSAEAVAQLPTHVFLQTRAEAYRNQDKAENDQAETAAIECDAVCDNAAVSSCCQCSMNFCDKHQKKHLQVARFKNHHFTDLQAHQPIVMPPTCVGHEGQQILMCCTDCCKLLCLACLNGNVHDKHSIRSLAEALTLLKVQAKEDIGKLQAMRELVQQECDVVKRNIDTLDEKYAVECQKVQQYFDVIMAHLVCERSKRLAELGKAHRRRIKPLEGILNAKQVVQLTQSALQAIPTEDTNMAQVAALCPLLKHTLKVAMQKCNEVKGNFSITIKQTGKQVAEMVDTLSVLDEEPTTASTARPSLLKSSPPTRFNAASLRLELGSRTTLSADGKTLTKPQIGHESVSVEGVIGQDCATEVRVKFGTLVHHCGWTLLGVDMDSENATTHSHNDTGCYGAVLYTAAGQTLYLGESCQGGKQVKVATVPLLIEEGAIVSMRVDLASSQLILAREGNKGWQYVMQLPSPCPSPSGWRFHFNSYDASVTLL